MKDVNGSHLAAQGGAARPLFVAPDDLSAPPVTFRVEDLLLDGALHVLAGRDKLGKTLLALEIARCVARGRPLFGRFPARPGTVLAALLDDPLGVTLDRVAALGLRREHGGGFLCCDPAAFGDPGAFLARLEREAAALRPGLIIVDALYLFLPQSRDAGNDAARMAPVMAAFDRLATRTGAAVLVIAHVSKQAGDVAGSYVVRAAAKAVLRLTLPRGEEDGSTPRRVLRLESKVGPRRELLLEVRGVGEWALLGDPAAVRADDLRAAVEGYLAAGGQGTSTTIAGALGRRREAVESVLRALAGEGRIGAAVVPTGRRPAIVYARAGDFGPPGGTEIPHRDKNAALQLPEISGDSPNGGFLSRTPGLGDSGRDKNKGLTPEDRARLEAEAAAGDPLAALWLGTRGEA